MPVNLAQKTFYERNRNPKVPEKAGQGRGNGPQPGAALRWRLARSHCRLL